MPLTPGIKKSPPHTFFFPFNLVLKKATRANTDKSCTTSWIISLLSCLSLLTFAEKRKSLEDRDRRITVLGQSKLNVETLSQKEGGGGGKITKASNIM